MIGSRPPNHVRLTSKADGDLAMDCMVSIDLDRVAHAGFPLAFELRKELIEHADDPISGGCVRCEQHRCPRFLRLRRRLIDLGIEDGAL